MHFLLISITLCGIYFMWQNCCKLTKSSRQSFHGIDQQELNDCDDEYSSSEDEIREESESE